MHNEMKQHALGTMIEVEGYIESITPSHASCSPGIFISYFLLAGRVPEDTANRPEETHERVSTLVWMCSFSLDTLWNGRSIVEVEKIP
jgi:hypothetical protein